MPDLLATSGDFLRIWKIESGGDDVHGNGMATDEYEDGEDDDGEGDDGAAGGGGWWCWEQGGAVGEGLRVGAAALELALERVFGFFCFEVVVAK